MKRLNLALVAACVSFAYVASAEELRLKTRMIDPTLDNANPLLFRSAATQPRSMGSKRWHWLIQFDSDAPDFSQWIRRGATVLSSVPVNGFVISAPEAMSWQDLAFTYRAPIDAADKLSPQIVAASILAGDATAVSETTQKSLVIIHFHKDVEAWEADGILAAESVAAIKNGSLESVDRLAELTGDQLIALQLWDEVEFIFPAPNEMKEGELYMVCGGVLSAGYEVAMLAASFGEGWDGPGRGRASISYSFGNLGTRTDPSQTRAEVRRALDQWTRAVAVTFTESTARNATRNIDILFATGEHSDPFPFLSGTTVLAHSFYPAPPNPEPIAGDIHINNAWSWSIGGQWDIYSVVLHELGHSLGIGHTDTPGTVMYPYYQKAEGLKPQDIDSMRQLYADPGTPTNTPFSFAIVNPVEGTRLTTNSFNLNGTILGANSSFRLEYFNEANAVRNTCITNSTKTTFSCAAIPLTVGSNAISLTGSANGSSITQRRSVVRESDGDVALTISSPAVSGQTTTAPEILISGTAAHPGGIASVTWATNRNKNGTASGLESWAATVALETGTNEITLTANSRSGIGSTRKITVVRNATTPPTPPTPPADPTGDKVPPRMTIQQPIGNFIITSAAKLTFRGAATDNISVKQVTWTNSAGDQSGAAASTTSGASINWSFDVNIAVGFNAIQVRAWDISGNSTLYSTTVRRY